MVIRFDFPVLDSKADTFKIPLASISKVTSILGTPLGAGGIPVRSKVPEILRDQQISPNVWNGIN